MVRQKDAHNGAPKTSDNKQKRRASEFELAYATFLSSGVRYVCIHARIYARYYISSLAMGPWGRGSLCSSGQCHSGAGCAGTKICLQLVQRTSVPSVARELVNSSFWPAEHRQGSLRSSFHHWHTFCMCMVPFSIALESVAILAQDASAIEKGSMHMQNVCQ